METLNRTACPLARMPIQQFLGLEFPFVYFRSDKVNLPTPTPAPNILRFGVDAMSAGISGNLITPLGLIRITRVYS